MSSYKRDYHDILTTQGVNRELWKWLRGRAAIETRSVGEILNELIYGYRQEVGRTGRAPQLTSSYELESKNQHSIRGIDRDQWRWLKAHCIFEERYLGDIVNALIEQYMGEVGEIQ